MTTTREHDPAWLSRLRSEMRIEIGAVGSPKYAGLFEQVANLATALAATHIAPLYQRIEDLEGRHMPEPTSTITTDLGPSPCALCDSRGHVESFHDDEPGWLFDLRDHAMNTAKEIRDNFEAGGRPTLGEIAAPFIGLAASYLHPVHADLNEAKQEFGAAMGRLGAQAASLIEKGQQLRARDARITELEAMIRSPSATVTAATDLGAGSPEYGECDHCGGAHFTGDHAPIVMDMAMRLPGPMLDRLGILMARREASSPETREVPLAEWRPGDIGTLTVKVRDPHGPGDIVGFRFGGYGLSIPRETVEQHVTVTRPVTPLPDKPGAVIWARIGDLTAVAELFDDGRWHTTFGASFAAADVVLVEVLRSEEAHPALRAGQKGN